MQAGFGGGMFIGSICGALVGCVAALSKYIVKTKAHETQDLRENIQNICIQFKKELGALDCAHVKALHHDPQKGCLHTCLLAGKAFEKCLK